MYTQYVDLFEPDLASCLVASSVGGELALKLMVTASNSVQVSKGFLCWLEKLCLLIFASLSSYSSR